MSTYSSREVINPASSTRTTAQRGEVHGVTSRREGRDPLLLDYGLITNDPGYVLVVVVAEQRADPRASGEGEAAACTVGSGQSASAALRRVDQASRKLVAMSLIRIASCWSRGSCKRPDKPRTPNRMPRK